MKFRFHYILVLILGVHIIAQAQIQLKSVEKRNGENQRFLVDVTTGNILKDEVGENGNKRRRITNDDIYSGEIPANEEILHFTNDHLYAATNSLGTINLKKYSAVNNSIVFQNSLALGESATGFFDDGSLVALEAREDGGMHIKIYSSEFELIKDYVPFKDGYEYALFSIYENDVVIVIKPLQAQINTQIVGFTNKGEMVFNKTVNEGQIFNILGGKKYFAVYSFDGHEHSIIVYDKKGILLWKSRIDKMVQKWNFLETNTPSLVIGTASDLYILNARNGSLIERKKLTELYDELHIKRLRPDDYVEVLDIMPILNNQFTGVLLTEPTGINSFKNIILYSFGDESNPKRQLTKLGDSLITPYMKGLKNELLIIKDKEILRYGL